LRWHLGSASPFGGLGPFRLIRPENRFQAGEESGEDPVDGAAEKLPSSASSKMVLGLAGATAAASLACRRLNSVRSLASRAR
jgi:hypothetical protein